MNILFILPSLRLAGAERQTVDLVSAISGCGHVVHLMTFEPDLDLKLSLMNTSVVFHHHLRKHKFDFSNISRIAKIIDLEKIDIVHCTLQISLLFGFLGVYRSKRKPKLIDAIHTTINRDRKHEIFDRLLYVPMMRRCDRIISVCDSQKNHWLKKYPFLDEKLLTVHNGIDTEYFTDRLADKEKAALRRELGIQNGELVIGMVAGFRLEKNHKEVFLAVQKLVKKGLPVKLMLVGDGSCRATLMAKAQELDINDYLIWVGFTNDARRYISLFDIGVLFSYAVETFSMAILEMMAMGKPVVAADIGGTKEMVQDGVNGYLVPPRDISMLVNRFECLLRDTQHLNDFGVIAAQTVRQYFTQNKMVEKMIRILEEVHAA